MFRALVSILILVFVTIRAQADVAACKAMFETAPASLDRHVVGDRAEFEPTKPGLGYAVAYWLGSDKLSVIYYDYQHPVITDDILLSHFRNAVSEIQQVLEQQGMTMGEVSAYRLGAEAGLLSYYAETSDSSGRRQILGMGVRDNCIIKMRYTSSQAGKAAQVRFERLVTALAVSF